MSKFWGAAFNVDIFKKNTQYKNTVGLQSLFPKQSLQSILKKHIKHKRTNKTTYKHKHTSIHKHKRCQKLFINYEIFASK